MIHHNGKSVLCLLILLSCSAAMAAGLGVNISLPERGGTFVDVVKENHRWLNPNSWSALENVGFDERGWPLVDAMLLIDARPVAEWAGEIDDPENYRVDWSGVYACSFSGQATVQSRGEGTVRTVTYDADRNTTTFEYVLPEPHDDGYGFFVLSFTQTRRTPADDLNSGLTDLKMIRPGYDGDSDQVFTNDFIHALTTPRFAAIRYKDFTGVDGCDPVYPSVLEWAERKLPTDASQARLELIGKADGAAWEYVIELANATHIDPWINVPVSATTDYVAQLATLFKENLHPDLDIYVESSNEVWNTAPGYEQTQYSKEQAAALGIGERENHARRTVELAQIFESVYGQGSLNDKIRVVLCSHAPMLKWWVQPMLDYIKKTFGDVNQFVYALACQTYYSGGADAGESVDKILQDCRASIASQMDEPGGNQAGRKQWIAKAAEFGLPGGFCSYEGGPDHGGGSTTNLDNRISAERSAGMGDVFKYNIDDAFFQLGANLAVQFTLTSAYNRYGCWGLTDDIADPNRNAKFQAARDLIVTSRVISRQAILGYDLAANYPNPFNPETTIAFSIPQPEYIRLEIFDVSGKKVRILADRHFAAGQHALHWDGAAQNGLVASGVYFYRLQAGSFAKTKSMLLLR
ncbi:T9SS type A sorting domain-containing protein [candidate division KSB1 bacterium]|nr:T9SS type A sorting domain-containing protein [candidate division KSB1 bacterium]